MAGLFVGGKAPYQPNCRRGWRPNEMPGPTLKYTHMGKVDWVATQTEALHAPQRGQRMASSSSSNSAASACMLTTTASAAGGRGGAHTIDWQPRTRTRLQAPRQALTARQPTTSCLPHAAPSSAATRCMHGPHGGGWMLCAAWAPLPRQPHVADAREMGLEAVGVGPRGVGVGVLVIRGQPLRGARRVQAVCSEKPLHACVHACTSAPQHHGRRVRADSIRASFGPTAASRPDAYLRTAHALPRPAQSMQRDSLRLAS